MNKKNLLLIGLAVFLALIYAVFFTDWFRSQTVKISHIHRNLGHRQAPGDAMPNLVFFLNRSFRLTEIKVVPLADYKTNPKILPLWHLVSDSNSVPIKNFYYGQSDRAMRGLKPAVPGTLAQPLTNHVTYRIFVQAGQIQGEHDFELR